MGWIDPDFCHSSSLFLPSIFLLWYKHISTLAKWLLPIFRAKWCSFSLWTNYGSKLNWKISWELFNVHVQNIKYVYFHVPISKRVQISEPYHQCNCSNVCDQLVLKARCHKGEYCTMEPWQGNRHCLIRRGGKRLNTSRFSKRTCKKFALAWAEHSL